MSFIPTIKCLCAVDNKTRRNMNAKERKSKVFSRVNISAGVLPEMNHGKFKRQHQENINNGQFSPRWLIAYERDHSSHEHIHTPDPSLKISTYPYSLFNPLTLLPDIAKPPLSPTRIMTWLIFRYLIQPEIAFTYIYR